MPAPPDPIHHKPITDMPEQRHLAEPQPQPVCGSWRVTRYVEGNEADLEWCGRTCGPCPYVGTRRASFADQEARPCAAEPGR